MLGRIEAELARAFERVFDDDCASSIFGAVDPVRVAGKRRDARRSVKGDRQAEKEMTIFARRIERTLGGPA